jgi:diguanylate cyclase (GGDEF)-like protein/PAS domain S-box-containing protein
VGSIKEKIEPVLRKKPVLVLVLCGLVFAAALILLFTQEKRRLDVEFASMITSSLNIHTQSKAGQIDKVITETSSTMRVVETMLSFAGRDTLPDALEQIRAVHPDYTIEYAAAEDVVAGTLPSLAQNADQEAYRPLARGETVVGDIHYDASLAEYYLIVAVPLPEEDGTTGALYIRINAEGLLAKTSEGIVYQHVQSSLITGDGDIVFNTFVPDQNGNLFDTLDAYGLTQAEVERIADIIRSPDLDSATFIRHGETYFVSAARLKHNGWQLVSFVRGPDVLLRSATIFQDVVRTSTIAILLTATAACIIFILLLFSRTRLEEEQRRNHALAQRLQAMFNQHSALKVVFDATTGEIVDVNPSMLGYLGYTKAEVLGQRVQEFNLLSPEIQNEKFQGELSGEVLFSAAPHRLKSGETKFLDVYASVVLDGERRLLYAIFFDVTDRERYREELLQEKELLRTTLQSIGDGVVSTDNLGMITGMNRVAENLTGWDSPSAMGRPFTDVFILQNEDTGQPVENPVQKVLETGLVIGLANHTELINRRGERIPIADSAAPIQKAKGERTFGVVMIFRDVSAERKHRKQIEFLSYHDSLTGLYNRRYIEETLIRLDAAEHLPVSVIMADVNGLKITNDVFGHKAGDELLKNVADLMRKSCKEDDLIARWGGDEFVILMPGTSLEVAEGVIRRIKNTHIAIEGNNLSFSLSLGCACSTSVKKGLHAIMQQAEEYMYHQKLLDGKSYRNAIISTLLATLYEKSNETEAHAKRIEKYCHAIGRKLWLSSKEMDELSLLALLHDIGKVGIHPNILKKPGPLTLAEWDEMKRHPEIGYRIAQATPELAVLADLILSHHERWDGTGYPRGLKEGEIPRVCRILSVVDAFDAMTSDRVYRPSMTIGEAILELEKNAGKQFDPQAVKLLIEIIASENEPA